MSNIQDLTNGPNSSYLTLLNIFAFGNYKSLLECTEPLPEVTETMRRKLRLLTAVSLAEQNKMLAYNLLMSELDINTVRDLEDLVIEGISAGVIQGKLDQKSSHFEVDYVIGRDIRKSDIGSIVSVLSAWCDNCDNMIKGIESQVDKVNVERQQHLRNQPGDEDGCADSRMDTERMSVGGERCKKAAKGKGIRGSSKSGGSTSFWKQ